MATYRRIGLIVHTGSRWGRSLARGAAARAHRAGAAWCHLFDLHRDLEALAGAELDGVIGQIWPAVVEPVRSLGVPVVDCTGLVSHSWTALTMDYAGLGAQGARHLLEGGRAGLLFVGPPDHTLAGRMAAGFCRAAGEAGVSGDWRVRVERCHRPGPGFAARVAALPRPAGIMVFGDAHAISVARACAEGGLAIPEAVAVMSVGDDELLCTLNHPPLTSLRLPGERLGAGGGAAADEPALARGDRSPGGPLERRAGLGGLQAGTRDLPRRLPAAVGFAGLRLGWVRFLVGRRTRGAALSRESVGPFSVQRLRPAESGMRKAESGQRPAASGKRQAESGKRRAASGKRRAESGERQAESGQRPAESGRISRKARKAHGEASFAPGLSGVIGTVNACLSSNDGNGGAILCVLRDLCERKMRVRG